MKVVHERLNLIARTFISAKEATNFNGLERNKAYSYFLIKKSRTESFTKVFVFKMGVKKKPPIYASPHVIFLSIRNPFLIESMKCELNIDFSRLCESW